jgi:predicted metal-binding membrane protein
MAAHEAPSLDRWLEPVLRRDRAVTAAGLAALTGLAWLYIIRLSGNMADMAAMGMVSEAWTAADLALAVAMWAAMMVAMMLPTAAPMVLTFVTVNRRRQAEHGAAAIPTGLFTLGYLLVWGGFSVVAALGQWGLRAAAVLAEDALTIAPALGGGVLAAAGLYQLTPLKYACLARCQSPLGFIMSEWREGRRGALVMGLRHGLLCLGCCWVLMALLFVGGAMNLAWVAAISVFVLVEKVVPAGRLVSWASGAALILWGLVTLGAAR